MFCSKVYRIKRMITNPHINGISGQQPLILQSFVKSQKSSKVFEKPSTSKNLEQHRLLSQNFDYLILK